MIVVGLYGGGKLREREVVEERRRRRHRLETRATAAADGGGRRWKISWRSSSQKSVSIFFCEVFSFSLRICSRCGFYLVGDCDSKFAFYLPATRLFLRRFNFLFFWYDHLFIYLFFWLWLAESEPYSDYFLIFLYNQILIFNSDWTS